eukprot:CAMPEP_0194046456 /NCGR_PEP_ID=MMETSP0009_2-20130614/21120_1 /TAXON_ID=210454 /ORGANISM="Grammatophora oceanica, Strain CCMP 410" /LENGTH=344 /DNA_ID=CAMNT_0038691751 /DNA_START=125 /DNA_END=1159 /DNA_ORIENTATION=+
MTPSSSTTTDDIKLMLPHSATTLSNDNFHPTSLSSCRVGTNIMAAPAIFAPVMTTTTRPMYPASCASYTAPTIVNTPQPSVGMKRKRSDLQHHREADADNNAPSTPRSSNITSNKNKRTRRHYATPSAFEQPQQQQRKSVRFSPAITVCYDNEDLNDNLVQSDLWWSHDELMDMKRHAKQLAQHIAAKHAQHVQQESTTATSNNNNDSSTSIPYVKVVEGVYKSCIKAPSDERKVQRDLHGLMVWAQHGHSRRGLERWSVKHLGAHCAYRRQMMMHRMAKCIESYNTNNNNAANQNNGSTTSNSLDEALAKICRYYTKPSQQFALAMGASDSVAARAEHNHDTF